MIAFARTCAAIAATASKLEKIALVAAYLRELDDADLAPAARFFSGNPFPQAQQRSLALGGRSIVAAATAAWQIDPAQLSQAYRATGDLGAALGPFVRAGADLGLFREVLTPARLAAIFVEIADAAGKSAQKRRRVLCEQILSSCTDPLEATYVIKVMTGELRIGLRAGLIVDAIATAFARDPAATRAAAAAAGDLGSVAIAAKADRLGDVAIAYHAPIAFMLASPIAYETAHDDLAGETWLVEDKFDGIRIQAHVTPERVSLFTRTLNDSAGAYPEVVAALRALRGSYILDGELIAVRDGGVLPFRFLQARLQRTTVSADLQREVPVRFIAFDVLAHNDAFLLDVPLARRRATLLSLVSNATAIAPSDAAELPPNATADDIAQRFTAARERGNEGLVFKRLDAPYAPGRRGKWWLKLKRELATLDCVVVAVEWGHGRRAGVLSDYTFAVRDGDRLAVIGKAYSGLTDVEIAEMTAWFEAHRIPAPAADAVYDDLRLRRGEIVVEPAIVVEIAFDIIARSDLHAGGFSLRFPRIVRLRPDKPAEQADTLARVAELYAAMLERERITEKRPDSHASHGTGTKL
jgi:DNA ligase-1